MSDPIPTPEEFASAVREVIAEVRDEEFRHCKTDDLMERALIALGYGEAVELIRETERWYA